MTEDTDSEIIHRELDTENDDSSVAVVEAVADIENGDASELPPLYNCIDGMLDHMYSNPPSQDAQVEVCFTYAGYRITVEQSGVAKFVRVSDPVR